MDLYRNLPNNRTSLLRKITVVIDYTVSIYRNLSRNRIDWTRKNTAVIGPEVPSYRNFSTNRIGRIQKITVAIDNQVPNYSNLSIKKHRVFFEKFKVVNEIIAQNFTPTSQKITWPFRAHVETFAARQKLIRQWKHYETFSKSIK